MKAPNITHFKAQVIQRELTNHTEMLTNDLRAVGLLKGHTISLRKVDVGCLSQGC